MNTKYYDVIVAGAGPAGICAAVAAARQGARVALIERYGVIGGNLTAGYVGPILGSVSKNTMRDEVCAILGVKDNDWIGEHGNAHDFEEAKLTLAEFVAREKNIDVFLQCCVSDVIRDGKVVKGIKCASNEGTLCFEAAVTIDCTGDAIVSFLAGAKIEKGRADGLMQPVTLEYTIDGVDESKGIICIGDVDNVQLNGECFLDWCKKKADEGKLPRMLAAVRLHPSVRPGCRQVSGTTTGVRESRRVMGDYVIDADEMAEGCRFADVVVHKALFIVDIHNPDGAGQAEPTIQYCKPYDLPYRCFLPLGLEGLLVAGRCISGTHRAHASYRVMSICMAMGEAVGIAAAMSASQHCTPRALDVGELQKRLESLGVELFD